MKNIALAIMCMAAMLAHAQVYDITSYGAVGDGTTLNTSFIQAAVDACSAAGGGVVEVPAGNFLTATIFLKSNVTFQIDSGATITGSTQVSDYPDVHPQLRTYADNYPQKSVFYAEGQHNIAITGKGTFEGNGLNLTWLLSQNDRPLGFRFISCTNVRYEGVTLHNSAFWMMHNCDIDTLIVKNVTINNQALGNNDGVNIDGCRHVLVDSVFADCNDDPMVIKTTSPYIEASDIEIKNCTVATYSRAIKIGTETNGITKNVYIHECTVQPSTGPLTGRFATCGINLSTVDGGGIENVLIENIHMTGIETPFLVRLGNRARKYNDTATTQGVGYVHNVIIRDIEATAETNITSTVTGIPGYHVQAISFINLYVSYPGGSPALSTGYVVPENETAKPDNDIFGDSIPSGGLYIRHADSILLYNVCFTAIQPDARPTIWRDDVTHYDTAGVCGNTVATAINEQIGASNLKLYPNPVTGNLFTVEADNKLLGSTIVITDASGRQIQQSILNRHRQVINTNALSAGVYIIQIRNTSGLLAIQKLVKY